MISMLAARQVLCSLAALGAAVGLMACSAGLDSDAPKVGLSCVDDSKHCIDQRSAALHAIMSDKQRTWVREQPSPAAYASGVRLFAFKTRKKELTCDELAVGRREADSAATTLRGPGSHHLSPAQVSRGVMLCAEVSRELASEMKRRSKA